jgi:hypothetical protein
MRATVSSTGCRYIGLLWLCTMIGIVVCVLLYGLGVAIVCVDGLVGYGLRSQAWSASDCACC